VSNEEEKTILKEALKEWLDEKVTQLGWYTIKTAAILILGAVTYFILVTNGWHK